MQKETLNKSLQDSQKSVLLTQKKWNEVSILTSVTGRIGKSGTKLSTKLLQTMQQMELKLVLILLKDDFSATENIAFIQQIETLKKEKEQLSSEIANLKREKSKIAVELEDSKVIIENIL